MRNSAIAATLLACAPIVWARPAKHGAGRPRAAAGRSAAKTTLVRKPAFVTVRCKVADFTFDPAGDTADVADRDFGDPPAIAVADLRSSPGNFVVSWERSMGTMVGPRRLRYRYLINRETGRTSVQTVDETPGMPPFSSDREEQCTIER